MDTYNSIKRDLIPLLKECGFIKKGRSFYLKFEKNYGVISFQKGSKSNKDVVLFTMNFGVYSNLLGEKVDGFEHLEYPEVERCQWTARIGSFMPGLPDYWWQIETNINDTEPYTSIMFEQIKTMVIPELKKRLTDEGLIETWINGEYTGTTGLMKFIYLTTFLKIKNEHDALKEVIKIFLSKEKGRPNEVRALDHLKAFNIETNF